MANGNNHNNNFLDENGLVDVEQLLAINPNSLARGPKNPQRGEGEGGSAKNPVMSPVMPVTLADAASRLAEGKSLSYVPAGAAPMVQNMAASAQHNLGIEEVNGFQMNGPNPGGSQFPMGSGKEDGK